MSSGGITLVAYFRTVSDALDDAVYRALTDPSADLVAVALRGILHNRLSFGGTFKLAKPEQLARRVNGPMRRLWCPDSLVGRIDVINQDSSRFDLRVGNGIELITGEPLPARATLYADPPYVGMGRKFYSHWRVASVDVSRIANRFGSRFLISTTTHRSFESLQASIAITPGASPFSTAAAVRVASC